MLNQIQVVLVGTSHPGNIGGVARAMKNMGLTNLRLVAPRAQFPHPEADLRSAGATDILEAAQVYSTLAQALADCTLVAGASARSRHLPWPLLTPRELAANVPQELARPEHRLALVLGREDRGLSNDELHLCHWHVQIPCNPEFSSLNLAAALQVLAYELRLSSLATQPPASATAQLPNDNYFFGTQWDAPLAKAEDLENFFTHLEQTLVAIDFYDPNNPRQLLSRLRRLFLRARPDAQEVNLLRGILTLTQKAAAKQPASAPNEKPQC